MVINKKTILGLNEILRLDSNGNEQDWPIEFADKTRILEFINILNNNKLSHAERYAVMSLILASYDDLLDNDVDNNEIIWNMIVKVLNDNKSNYESLLAYWTVGQNEDTEQWFSITPLIREYFIKSY